MGVPKAFISYSHDTQAHKQWVLALATRLRNTGVDANLDQWDLRPGDDLPAFMERHLRTADRVLMICTDQYVVKANAGKGGVGYEKMIITSDLMQGIDSNKVIPIIKQTASAEMPTFLKTKLYVDFSREDQYEFAFDELVRSIHNAPLYKKPPIGNNPFQPVSEVPAEKTGDPIREIMKRVIDDYEQGETYTDYADLVRRSGISRIYLDLLIAQAVSQGLLQTDEAGDLYLSTLGKRYAIEHRLVRV